MKEASVEDTDDKALPPNLRKRPSLKKPVESENLSKNRNSYQLPSNVAVSQKMPKEVAEKKKSSRTKRLSQVKTPEGLKVKKKKTKKQCGVDEVEETAEVGQKVKRLSEVKTPEALKKKTNKK